MGLEACANGHPWTPENTYTNPSSGYRVCRECRRVDKRKWVKKNQTRPCSVDGCDRTRMGAMNLCPTHHYANIKDRPKPRCTVDGCERPRHWEGLCQAHHARLVRNGDVMADVPVRDHTAALVCTRCGAELAPVAERSGTGTLCGPCKQIRNREWRESHHCSIDGCRNLYDSRGYCDTHLRRLTRLGDPLAEFDVTGENSPQYKGDKIKYRAAVSRVREQRGDLTECEFCGTTDPDKFYAWMLNPEVDESHVVYGYNTSSGQNMQRFSLDIYDYVRVCLSCKQYKVFETKKEQNDAR